MAEQLENKEEVLFQLWTIPQQELVKTIIQQPAETHMELNASTDKTAIGSFGFSVVIALILAGLATWYAYWCAKKSFELTKQSFDSLIFQIKSSEQTNFESNKLLIESQNNLKIKEQILIQNNNELMLIVNAVSDIYSASYELINERILIVKKNVNYERLDQIQANVNKLVLMISRLLVFIGFENDMDKSLRRILLNFQHYAWLVYVEALESVQDEKKLDEQLITEFSKEFIQVQKTINQFISLKKAA